jgi:TM2 domain
VKRGGGNEVTDDCCYEERCAVGLAILLGLIGVDQFYAHHWALAVFKLLTIGGFGIWYLVDIGLWMRGVYTTPSC